MTPVTGMHTSAAQSLTAAEKILGTPGVQCAEETARDRSLKPAADEYVPEEKQEPSGRYWMGRDENGRPEIVFDAPASAEDRLPEDASGAEEPAQDAPGGEEPAQNQGAKGPEKKSGKEQRCVGNTDKVDREIERLKKKKEELERRLHTETGEPERKALEKQLAQVERELREKDNDAYRKQHSTFTQLA